MKSFETTMNGINLFPQRLVVKYGSFNFWQNSVCTFKRDQICLQDFGWTGKQKQRSQELLSTIWMVCSETDTKILS